MRQAGICFCGEVDNPVGKGRDSMQRILIAAAACATLIAAMPDAQAQTREQIKAECRAIHGGSQGMRRAERTGVTNAQAIARCVQNRMRGKK